MTPSDAALRPEPNPAGRPAGRRPSPLAWLLLLPVRLYRKALGPLLPPSCRFYPSCSTYAMEALTRHGATRGCYLTAVRLAKCAPWHPGGIDEVPERFTLRVRWDTHDDYPAPQTEPSTQE